MLRKWPSCVGSWATHNGGLLPQTGTLQRASRRGHGITKDWDATVFEFVFRKQRRRRTHKYSSDRLRNLIFRPKRWTKFTDILKADKNHLSWIMDFQCKRFCSPPANTTRTPSPPSSRILNACAIRSVLSPGFFFAIECFCWPHISIIVLHFCVVILLPKLNLAWF